MRGGPPRDLAQGTRSPDAEGAREQADEHRVTPLELFFDLVLVFAFTQVTRLLADDPTWGGVLRGMLVLAALWFAWNAYAWLTSATDVDEGGVRLAMRPRRQKDISLSGPGALEVRLLVPDLLPPAPFVLTARAWAARGLAQHGGWSFNVARSTLATSRSATAVRNGGPSDASP